MSVVANKPTSISSFFFNSCANSARVSRKVAVLGVAVDVVVGGVDAGVVVDVAEGFSFVAVELAGDVAAVVESFIFFSFPFRKKKKKHTRALPVLYLK